MMAPSDGASADEVYVDRAHHRAYRPDAGACHTSSSSAPSETHLQRHACNVTGYSSTQPYFTFCTVSNGRGMRLLRNIWPRSAGVTLPESVHAATRGSCTSLAYSTASTEHTTEPPSRTTVLKPIRFANASATSVLRLYGWPTICISRSPHTVTSNSSLYGRSGMISLAPSIASRLCCVVSTCTLGHTASTTRPPRPSAA